MKYLKNILLVIGLCSACETWIHYRFKVINDTNYILRVEAKVLYGNDSLVVDTIPAMSEKRILQTDGPILGCQAKAPDRDDFHDISSFVITAVDTTGIVLDVRDRNLWSFESKEVFGYYTIRIDDSTLFK